MAIGADSRRPVAGLDNGQQRAVRVRARPRRRGGEGRLLRKDGVCPREGDVLTPRGSQAVELAEVGREPSGRAV